MKNIKVNDSELKLMLECIEAKRTAYKFIIKRNEKTKGGELFQEKIDYLDRLIETIKIQTEF